MRKSGGCKIDVARLGYHEQPWCSHLPGVFNRNEKAKTLGNLPAGPNDYLAPSLGQIGEKSGGYKIDVARLGYNEHFFEELLIETKSAKTTEYLPAWPE